MNVGDYNLLKLGGSTNASSCYAISSNLLNYWLHLRFVHDDRININDDYYVLSLRQVVMCILFKLNQHFRN